MDSNSCHNCIFFKKYENAVIAQTKKEPSFPIVILDALPRDKEGAINYEDIVLADNIRKNFGTV